MDSHIAYRSLAVDTESAYRFRSVTLATLVFAALTLGQSEATGANDKVTRISENKNGLALGDSGSGAISFDARYAAFASTNPRLVKNDRNGVATDIFLKDLQTGVTKLVSVDNDGSQLRVYGAPSGDEILSLSDQGRYIAFNAVVSDQAGLEVARTFVRDRLRGWTLRLPIEGGGQLSAGQPVSAGPVAISGNGRVVAVVLEGVISLDGEHYCGHSELFTYDRWTGVVDRVMPDVPRTVPCPLRSVLTPRLSGDGTYLAFTELDYGSGEGVVYVYNRWKRQRERVDVSSSSVSGNGQAQLGAMTPDGRYVLFASNSNNLVEGDSNEQDDVFIHDRVTRETARVNVTSSGAQANGYTGLLDPLAMSADGQIVAFVSSASNLDPGHMIVGDRQIFIHDRGTRTTHPSGIITGPAAPSVSRIRGLSADGRQLLFDNYGRVSSLNGRHGHWDAFVFDRTIDQSVRSDLALTQTVTPQPFQFRHPLTYTLSIANQGGATADDVLLSDRLASSVRLLSASPSQGSCAGEIIVVCRLGTLAPGGSSTVTLTLMPNLGVKGALPNTASISAAPVDPVPSNNRSVIITDGIP